MVGWMGDNGWWNCIAHHCFPWRVLCFSSSCEDFTHLPSRCPPGWKLSLPPDLSISHIPLPHIQWGEDLCTKASRFLSPQHTDLLNLSWVPKRRLITASVKGLPDVINLEMKHAARRQPAAALWRGGTLFSRVKGDGIPWGSQLCFDLVWHCSSRRRDRTERKTITA